MRASKYFIAGVVLMGLSLAWFVSHRAVKARSESPAGGQTTNKVVAKRAGIPLRQTWRLGSPINFDKLTIFPVLADGSTATQDFITLEEGLRSGKVTITEVGANGRSRRLRRGQEASDDADVNKLMLTNRSGKMLILIAGEIVVGGNQDRIVGHDCIVASSRTPVALDVFCVESGRWEERTAFGRSGDIEPVIVARSAGRANARPGTPPPAPPPPAVGAAPGGVSTFYLAAGVMAAPNVREKAQAAKDQSAVWTEIDETAKENNVTSSTGTLNAVFENKEVSANIDGYERALKNKLFDRRVVGIVVAVGGAVRSADVFANSRMFRSYWPKLLRSYALEAMSASESKGQSPDSKAAKAFLARVAGAKSSDGRKHVYKLTEHQSDTDASFELVSTKNRQPTLIHFNRVSKD